MLIRWGMKPTAVEGGEAALQALQIARDAGRPFPLILLDGQMPGMDGFTLAEQIKKNPEMVGATIMMLTSAGHLGDAARCRQLGISAYLVKPIRQGELLQAICNVLNLSRPEKSPLVTRHFLRETRNRAHVLLAEDNAVNQTLAVRLLERRGYNVTVAGNGKEALNALEREHVESHSDGRRMLEDGWLRSHRNHSPKRTLHRRPHSDRRHDCARSQGRRGALSRGRHGCVHFKTHSDE